MSGGRDPKGPRDSRWRRGPKAGPVVVAGLLVAVAAAMVLSARGPDPDAKPTAQAVDGRVMSTWCPGLTLGECPSGQAALLRQKIAAHVAEGWTNRQIDAWLVANYGEAVLGRPRSAGAFVVPLIAVVGGGLVVAFVLRRRLAPGPVAAPASSTAPAGSAGAPAAGAAPGAEAGARTGAEGDRADVWRARLEADLRRFAGEATE